MANKLVTSAMHEKRKLKHFGVLGMRWGIRKDEDPIKKYTIDSPKSTPVNKLSNYGIMDMNAYYTNSLGDKYKNFPNSYKSTLSRYWSDNKEDYWDSSKSTYFPTKDKQMFDFFNQLDAFINSNRGVASFEDLNKIPEDSNSMAVQSNWAKINDLDENEEAQKKIAELFANYSEYSKKERDAILDQYGAYNLNCTNCSAAYELRRRGYDVEAMPYNYNFTLNDGMNDISKNYKNGLDWIESPVDNKSKTEALVKEAILKISSENQRGYVVTDAHIFNYEVEKGKVNWIDGQIPTINNSETSKVLKKSSQLHIARTDNKELDESILARVRNRDEE